jgi:hypothetical protein
MPAVPCLRSSSCTSPHSMQVNPRMHSCAAPLLQVASSVMSGYSALGESASQIGAEASRAGLGCASRLGGGAGGLGSCAGSATSSALFRIAALEKELAVAKSESAQLRALVHGKGQV